MGLVTFNGLTLETAPGQVMTPRATSEQLVAEACARIPDRARVADVGTGNGAIAIAIAGARPGAEVWATDVDEHAVALACRNVARAGLGDRVHVCRGDLLEQAPGPFDLIVANLPYLAASTATRHPELRSEPFAAVFAAGDGLGPCRRLVSDAATKLASSGALLLQLHGRVIVAERADLPALLRDLQGEAQLALTGQLDLLRKAS
jgi:release factor glutamine methyltransferase